MTNEQPSSPAKSIFSRRRGVRLGRWLLVLALVLLLLPEVVRFALVKWLPDTGIGDVAIEDVDLNLFNATVGLEGVAISRQGENKLTVAAAGVDISWLKLLLGQLHIETATVDGVRLSARQHEDGHWEVVVPLLADASASPAEEETTTDATLPKIVLQAFTLNNAELTVASPMVSGVFAIDELRVASFTTWQSAPATVALWASWQQAPIELKLSVSPWVETPSLSGSLNLKALPLAGLQPLPGESLAGQIDTDLRFTLQKNPDAIAAEVAGNFLLEGFSTGYRNIALTHQQLTWQGEIHGAVPTQGSDAITYSVSGDIGSSELNIVEREKNINLLHWQSLQVDELVLDQTTTIAFSRLALSDMDALDLGDGNERLHTGAFEIRDAQLLSGARLHIDEILLSKGSYDFTVTEDGELQVESVLTQVLAGFEQRPRDSDTDTPSAPTPVAATDTAETTPLQVTINKLRIADDTQIRFTDRRFSVPVQERVIIEQLTVTGIDQVDPDSTATLSLNARIGEFSTVSAAGDIKLFAEHPAVNIKGELQAIELPPISPYAEAYLGYHLSRGQYDHEFDIQLADEKIKLENTLHLRQLKLASVDPSKPQPLERQLDVPLAAALDMLRDGDDNIELKVPIQGRLDDPDININSVINKALARAVKNGAASYLKFALQPYGAALMAAEYIGGQMTAVRLQPLVFAAGSDAMPEQADYIAKLLGLLQQRPQLHLSLCGQANAADREVLLATESPPDNPEAALAQLAERRATVVKRVFVEKDVESRRLLLCQPRYEPEGISGVQLAM